MKLMRVSFAALLMAAASVQGGSAQEVPVVRPVSGPWDGGKFTFASHENKTRRSVSGIACIARNGTDSTCLVAFDEGAEARFVTVGSDGYRIDNDQVVLRKTNDELDAEAATTDGTYYYVAGSHSAKRSTCENNPGSRRLIRFLVDPKSGKARREDGLLAGHADIDELWRVMASVPELRAHVGDGMCLGTEFPPEAQVCRDGEGSTSKGWPRAAESFTSDFAGPHRTELRPS